MYCECCCFDCVCDGFVLYCVCVVWCCGVLNFKCCVKCCCVFDVCVMCVVLGDDEVMCDYV